MDYDWLIVGSGFGGSVSALRLAEKGYRVGVLEAGRRYGDEDFAKSTWNLRRYLWLPAAGLRGILRLTPFSDAFIASGVGVGGGSVVYANTLYRASPEFFQNPQWRDLNDWSAALAPHYNTAEKMLGVVTVPRESDGQKLLSDIGQHFGVENTFRRTPVGVYFGEPETTVPDPYFDGEGPDRTGCNYCGACMVGCRHGAKNTLLKNYLWFAEKRGATIHPDREVVDIRPLGAADGSDGYEVVTEYPGAWFRKRRKVFTTKGVVVSAGALNTNKLLAKCKLGGSLPRISDRLGQLVRTNSESILAVTLPEGAGEPWNDVAISASIHPKSDTHIELVTYGRGGDFMSLLYTLLTGDGTRVTRPLMWLGNVFRHPITFLKTLWPFGWSRRTVIFLVMQTLDNAISFRAKLRRGGRVSLTTEQDPEKPNPTFIEVGNQAAEWLAKKTGGYAQSVVLEAWANIPTTAHILGGAAIGGDPSTGVVDAHNRVFGYENLLICDGSTVPANPGVNPALTITAMTEHAMSHVPAAIGRNVPESDRAEQRPVAYATA
ncbi:MAG: GMC family oxidoreductase [Myxococcales bacterium]|nr:MAG: GMC family oxidoreductase [Myxococcales bacterium]